MDVTSVPKPVNECAESIVNKLVAKHPTAFVIRKRTDYVNNQDVETYLHQVELDANHV